jgi:hypothetical protein
MWAQRCCHTIAFQKEVQEKTYAGFTIQPITFSSFVYTFFCEVYQCRRPLEFKQLERRLSRGRHGVFVLVSLLGSILSWEPRTVDAQYLISLDTLGTCLRWLDSLELGFTRNGVQGLIKEANATSDGIEVAAADGDPYPLCLGNITGDANDWPQMTVLAHPKVPTGTTQGELKADNTDEELNHPEQGTIVAMSRMII